MTGSFRGTGELGTVILIVLPWGLKNEENIGLESPVRYKTPQITMAITIIKPTMAKILDIKLALSPGIIAVIAGHCPWIS
ncbi:MAG TPA: hypothetical protein VJH69_04110 [Candidatus Paceibacterota bacterium]